MQTVIYKDHYNTAKTWKVETTKKVCYLTQLINGEQFGKRIKMTLEQVAEIGIFGFEVLSVIEPQKTKFIFSTSRMTETKTILAVNFDDAKRLAREYLNVERLPNDYSLNSISDNIQYLFDADIK